MIEENKIAPHSNSDSTDQQTASNVSRTDLGRRGLMLGAIPVGALGLFASTAQGQESAPTNEGTQKAELTGDKAASGSADRAAVLKAGMTEQEADCWQKIADAAGAFFQLPEMHPMDASEVASAVHIIQNKLLSRPTYRSYLAAHKAAATQKQGANAGEGEVKVPSASTDDD